MASSILRLTSQISKAAAGSCLRRVSISENNHRHILCSAGMSTATGGGDSAVRRIAPPWLMLPPSSEDGGDTAYSMCSLSQGKVVRLEQETKSPYPHHNDNPKVVGSSHGWLALFNERDRKLFLWNPISHENIKLPLIDNFSLPIKDVLKVTLLCPPDQTSECVAVMSFASAVGAKLAQCRPSWSTIWTPFGGLSLDIGFMKQIPDFVQSISNRYGRFFCLWEMEGKLGFGMGAWHLHRGRFDFVVSEPYLDREEKYEITRDDHHLRRRRYILYVEHPEQLFAVTRLLGDDDDTHNYKTVGFHVHRLCDNGFFGSIDECYMKESLDGMVMFVGPCHSAAVPAAEFPELKPNSIYFAGDDVGVYDYANKTISPCYYRNDVVQRIQPPAFWFTPSVPAQRWRFHWPRCEQFL